MKQRPGQAALIIALVVIVALTVGVGIAGRSVTTVSISTQEQDRARAFSAAEAGVEDALRQDLSTLIGSTQTINLGESSTNYQVSQLASATANVNPGEVVTIDWNSSTETAGVDVSWIGCSQLESTSIASNGNVSRSVFSGSSATVTKSGNRLARLRFINCSPVPAPVTITAQTAGKSLSFYQVDSLGTSTSGKSNSRVQVVRSAPAPPGIMDYAIFSGGSVQ